MDTVCLVEYRWNWEPDYAWKFMFVAESLDAVRLHLPQYCTSWQSSGWSKFWTHKYDRYTYARRKWANDYQTIRIRQVDFVPERRITLPVAV